MLDLTPSDYAALTRLAKKGLPPTYQGSMRNALAASLRKLGAKVELNAIPDWPPQGPPIATAVYDSVLWPVESVVTR